MILYYTVMFLICTFYIDREGLHRTIKADIANSTNVNPSYSGTSNELTIIILKHHHPSLSLSLRQYYYFV